ncbi:response regulator [Roseateles sp.]|uniref:response regulator n=1 Tax=Roseateles sp. TaxID=1971397 RepID=UPI002DFAF040|nr:response regulator [Roseateles sp.]HEV6967846.1 response regulator [Roseateles sp.]
MPILLVEDDEVLGQAVRDSLTHAGLRLHWCRTAADARAWVHDAPASLIVLLDLGLPDADGLSLLTEWRAAGRAWPVLVLTARDAVSERVRGLRAGADDYLVKPFDLQELQARVEALARRQPARARLRLRGGLELDLGQRRLLRDGFPVDLTAMEWAVLATLAGAPGRIVERSRLEASAEPVQKPDSQSNTLEVIVSRLRRKLGADLISTHRGLGYRFEP